MKLHELPSRGGDGAWHVVVESPRGARVKLKYEPSLGAISLSRPLTLGVSYPYDWGFIPSTRGPDGDPVDAMVLWDVPSFPGVVLPCRLVGVVRLEQNKKSEPGRERNDRVIAIPMKAPRAAEVSSVKDLPRRVLDELGQFFLSTTFFEHKDPKLLGWDDGKAAEELVRRCLLGRA